jgi:hypothetical protein
VSRKVKRHKHRRSPGGLTARPIRAPHSRKIKSGTPYRGIIGREVVEERIGVVKFDREYALHATKGYRAIRQ